MLIKINIEPTEFLEEEHADDSLFFSKIAESSRLGNHKIFMKCDLAEWICQNIRLIDKHKERIGEIGEHLSTMGFPANVPLPFLEVVHGSKECTKSGKNWSIGHRKLMEHNFLELSVLLAEGYSDCDLYELMLSAESERQKLGVLSFEAHATGGKDSMEKGLERFSNRHGIIVCIMDSDRIVPNGKINTKYYSACVVAKRKRQMICHVTHTPCHEAENFLPIEIINKASKQGSVNSRNLLKSLMDKPGHVEKGKCMSLFYDYGAGITESRLLDNCDNDQENISWVNSRYKNHLNGQTKLPIYGKNLLQNFLSNENLQEEFLCFIEGEEGVDWVTHFSDWFLEIMPYLIGEIPTNT